MLIKFIFTLIFILFGARILSEFGAIPLDEYHTTLDFIGMLLSTFVIAIVIWNKNKELKTGGFLKNKED